MASRRHSFRRGVWAGAVELADEAGVVLVAREETVVEGARALVRRHGDARAAHPLGTGDGALDRTDGGRGEDGRTDARGVRLRADEELAPQEVGEQLQPGGAVR